MVFLSRTKLLEPRPLVGKPTRVEAEDPGPGRYYFTKQVAKAGKIK